MNSIRNYFQLHRRVTILIIALILAVIVLGVILILIRVDSSNNSVIRVGENIRLALSEEEYVKFEFDDPIRTPDTVTVYPIYSAPEKLFSQAAIVNIASNIGFTSKASTQLTNEGYVYTENGNSLSINVTGGILTYSVPLEGYPQATQTITLPEAFNKAKEFVSKIGFDNPIYVWDEKNITLYTETGESVTESSYISEKTRLFIKILTRIGNAELYVPFEQYVMVHANGDIVGASLWYPFIDLSKGEQVEIIDYADATKRVRLRDIIRQAGNYSPTTVFSSSNLGYYIANDFFYNVESADYVTLPMYTFSNENVTVYVSASK